MVHAGCPLLLSAVACLGGIMGQALLILAAEGVARFPASQGKCLDAVTNYEQLALPLEG